MLKGDALTPVLIEMVQRNDDTWYVAGTWQGDSVEYVAL